MALPINKKILKSSPDEAAQGKVKGGDGGSADPSKTLGPHNPQPGTNLAPGEKPRHGPDGDGWETPRAPGLPAPNGVDPTQNSTPMHAQRHPEIKKLKPGAGLHDAGILGG